MRKQDAEDERLSAAYGPEVYAGLPGKAQYDPNTLFCSNQNIRPAASR
jgi:hypothetical protein